MTSYYVRHVGDARDNVVEAVLEGQIGEDEDEHGNQSPVRSVVGRTERHKRQNGVHELHTRKYITLRFNKSEIVIK